MEPHDPSHLYRTICCTACGHQLVVPVSCGNRFCTTCSSSRLGRIRAKLRSLVAAEVPAPHFGFKFLTLTIPNQSDIRVGSQLLLSAFRRLRQRALWKRVCVSGAYVLEVTGSTGKWHVHLHAILVSRFIPHRILSAIWFKCSGGKIVYIQAIPPRAAVNYLTKYLTKGSLNLPDQFTVSHALASLRWFSAFGRWHAVLGGLPKIKPTCPACQNDTFLVVTGPPWERFKRAHPGFS
jgi:hypothetical protein